MEIDRRRDARRVAGTDFPRAAGILNVLLVSWTLIKFRKKSGSHLMIVIAGIIDDLYRQPKKY
jgi:hypothetical protein